MIANAVKEGRPSGLRLMDPSRDLLQIATLIEESFAAEIGQVGLAAVRELRLMAHLGPFVWLLDRTTTEFRDTFAGYVWVEDGQIVGNVTISRASPTSSRWHISNVAVRETHQGRGIGRQLVEAGMELAEVRGGDWAILQVRHDNIPALRIYERLGFEALYGTSEMCLERLESVPEPEPTPGYDLHPARPRDWRREYELAIAATPPLERWARGVQPLRFQRSTGRRLSEWLSNTTSGRRTWRYCMESGEELAGTLTATARIWNDESTLSFLVHPGHRGMAEHALVGLGLTQLARRGHRRVIAEHSSEDAHGIDMLRQYGFVEKRRLLTMRRAL